MSAGSSGSLSLSGPSVFGGGPWTDSGERPLPAPPSPAKPPPFPEPPAAAVPLRPIPIPVNESEKSPLAVDALPETADVTLGNLLVDILKRKEFLVTVVSAGVHMVLVIVLALLEFTAVARKPVVLLASAEREVELPDLQPTPVLDVPMKAEGPLIRGVSQLTAPVQAPINLGTNTAAPKSLPSLNTMILSDATKTGGAGGLDSVSFFNSTAVAKRIVFIVDASTSMEGEKFERAKEELLTAVSNLNPRQRFFVYFFSDKEYAMFAPRTPTDMVPLDTQNWEALVRWVNDQGLVGDTRPRSALQRAFAMRPDMIYLLTDGDFNDDAHNYLMNVSNYRVRVNTIGFQTGAKARDVLEKIARKFRGEFTEVD
jgi:hypothetical protein